MDSFEKILREFEEREQTNLITKHQIIENYKDRKYLSEVENKYNLTYVTLTHPLF